MKTAILGAAGYWLYRSGRLDPYVQQLRDRLGMGSGGSGDSQTQQPAPPTSSYAASADHEPARPQG